MKVSLPGLFANVAKALPTASRNYYGFCLDEVLAHLRAVSAGEHTFEEFAEHYCISTSTQAPSKPEGV